MKISLATVHAVNEAMTELEQSAKAADLDVRWVAPASYHVTLKFIGWARPEVIDAIRDRVAEQLRGVSAFRFETRGMGAFPKTQKARVVWAGIDNPGGELSALAAKVDTAVGDLGFPAESREFHPHVTLGRLKQPAAVETVLEPWSEHLFSETFAKSVVLYESEMKSTGSEYHVRHEWPLEEASRAPKRHTD